jgi:hypothetical protein
VADMEFSIGIRQGGGDEQATLGHVWGFMAKWLGGI